MSKSTFDPFGEPVAAAEATSRLDASKGLRLGGVGLFWVLVFAIVLARAVFFEPSDLSFERVATWAKTLMASL